MEAFTNSTHLWDRRELAATDLYQSLHKHEFTFSTTELEQLRTEIKDTDTGPELGTNFCEYLVVFGFKICCKSRVKDCSELNSEPGHANASDSESLVTKQHHIGTDNNRSEQYRDRFHHGYAGLDFFKDDVGMHTHANVTQDVRSLADNHSLFELLDFYSKLRRRHHYTYVYMFCPPPPPPPPPPTFSVFCFAPPCLK